jgi:acyl-CoA dehydrogenase
MHDAIHKIQVALDAFLRNFPVRPVAWVLRALVFPLGLREVAPGDRLGRRVANLLMNPSESRDRLCEGIFYGTGPLHWTGYLERALPKVIQAEPVERKLAKALKAGQVTALDVAGQLEEAVRLGVLTGAERDLLAEVRAITIEIISVDDFTSEELMSVKAARPTSLRSVA